MLRTLAPSSRWVAPTLGPLGPLCCGGGRSARTVSIRRPVLFADPIGWHSTQPFQPGAASRVKPISCAGPGFRSHMACSLDQRRRASEVLVFGSRCCGTPKPPSPCSRAFGPLQRRSGAALVSWNQCRQRADSVHHAMARPLHWFTQEHFYEKPRNVFMQMDGHKSKVLF
jgi:hypothetical protein